MDEIPSGVTTGAADSSAATSVVESPTTQATSSAPTTEHPASGVTTDVQDSTTQTQDDPLANIPSLDELKAQENAPYAKGLAQLREAYEALKPKYSELETQHAVFAPFQDKFSASEEIQSLVDMRESLLGWENQNGQLVPSTERFIQSLDPQRAEFLFADLADGMSVGPNGQQIPRMDKALQFVAQDPERRANALRILGAVEPSAVAPQWQPTEEQLSVVKDELKDTFKKLPYDKREALSTNDPEFINDYLSKEKLSNDLIQEREQRAQRDQEAFQQREQMLQQEAARAGDNHVRTQLNEALTTFHNSVVDQCKLIEPIDPQNPPQGMAPQDVVQFNTMAEQTNKAEAATVTVAAIALVNPEVRSFVVPLLKEAGLIDDQFLADMDKYATGFGDNARNYGNLTYTQKQRSGQNGNYQPNADVTSLNTEANRNLKLVAYQANQFAKRMLEKKSQTFGMKATGHNAILNGVATSRPGANGGSFDPTTATTSQPSGKMTRAEIDARFG